MKNFFVNAARRVGVTATLPLMICGLLLSGCGKDQEGGAEGQRGFPEVGFVTIVPERVVYTTELAGRTTPYQIAEVRPQISGIIQRRLFEEGADVKAGDTLYQIDPAIYKANMDSAQAALAKAEANIEPVRLKRNRFKDLVNISAVSKQEYEDAEAAYKQALADVSVNKAATENARIRLEYTRVTSPISGRIGKSSVTPGALVTENQASFLATVQQLDPIYVDVTQSSMDVLRLKKALESGQLQKSDDAHALVRLNLEDGTPYAHTGTLQFTDVSVDKSTGMVTLRALFPNPNQDLLPNLYVRAELVEGIDDNAILVPQKSVMRDAKGLPTVYVVNADNVVELRKIKTNRTYGNSWVVSEGLAHNEKVVVDGIQRIRPGAKVKTVPVSVDSK